MRQTMSLPAPQDTALGRAVCAGCRQSLLGDGPSQRYLCNPCVGAWTHTPPRFLDACAHCFSKKHRPHVTGNTFSTRSSYPALQFCRAPFSRLQSFDHLQAPTLARPPGCTHRSISSMPGSRAVYTHASPGRLPVPGCGIATCLKWAIDMAGLPPAGLQPWLAAPSRTPLSCRLRVRGYATCRAATAAGPRPAPP